MTRPVHVLHVDDDPALLDIAATLLERADERLTVETETDPAKALDRVAEERVDCLVSDYDMPGMTGLDLLQGLQSRHPDLPFVLFTGTEDADVAAEALAGGATDYCRKQVGIDHYRVLAARIVDTVESHRERARLAEERDQLAATLRTFSAEVDRALEAGTTEAERVETLERVRDRLGELAPEPVVLDDEELPSEFDTGATNPFTSD